VTSCRSSFARSMRQGAAEIVLEDGYGAGLGLPTDAYLAALAGRTIGHDAGDLRRTSSS
jgi:hypothetical protein